MLGVTVMEKTIIRLVQHSEAVQNIISFNVRWVLHMLKSVFCCKQKEFERLLDIF